MNSSEPFLDPANGGHAAVALSSLGILGHLDRSCVGRCLMSLQ